VDLAGVAGPTEPEETGWIASLANGVRFVGWGRGRLTGEDGGADHREGKAPFWDGDVVVCFEFSPVGRVHGDHQGEADDDSDDHAEVRQARETWAEVVFSLEDQCIRCEETVQNAVCSPVSTRISYQGNTLTNKRHVDRDE
jgi:hypothetical protein